MTTAWTLILAVSAAWIALALFVRWIERASFRAPDDLLAGAFVRAFQLMARFVHRLRAEGAAEAVHAAHAARAAGRPVVVVANHTSWIDPMLIQSVLPFEVRWIMGADMASPRHKDFWDYARVILVDRRVNESAPLREAIRHLKSGDASGTATTGVIGVFPEGFIERPPRVIYPFKEGAGLIISRTAALVVPVVIDGTPQVEPGQRALWTPSRSALRFLPVIDFSARRAGPSEIARTLRETFLQATGWPPSELTPRWENGAWTEIGLDGREVRGAGTGHSADVPEAGA